MIYKSSERLRTEYTRLNREWVGALARHQVEMSNEMYRIKQELKERGITL